MRSFFHRCRNVLLHQLNSRRLRALSAELQVSERLPVFVLASPPDMHLAPLAVQHNNPRIQHIILGNGISASDCNWLREQAGPVPIVALKASLRRSGLTYLSHAEVVRLCVGASHTDFCIQDADCFVTDPGWWEELRFDAPEEFAAGPYYHALDQLKGTIPCTYLVLINKVAYRRREARGIRPDISSDATPLEPQLRDRGIELPYFPEPGKNYFDTLQKHWLAAVLEGGRFRALKGADQVVHHVGGSTYLTTRECSNVSHWDYWPLNTPYFHMRVLEFPRFAAIRPRFQALFDRHGSPERLLAKHPGFRQSQRFARSECLLNLYRPYLSGESS